MSIRVQLVLETFSGPDQNPIDPAKWTVPAGLSPVQLKSNIAIGTTVGGQTNTVNYTGTAFSNDQYVEATIGLMANGGDCEIVARTNAGATDGYILNVGKGADGSSSFAVFGGSILRFVGDGGPGVFFNNPPPIKSGDILAIECLGQNITFLYNGIVIWSQQDSGIASGVPDMNMAPASVVTDTGYSRFEAGNLLASSSPADSRSFGNFPNAAREIGGALTYDYPSVFSLRYWYDLLFNRTQGTPADSRTTVPVDSRISKPQNCRK